MLNQFEQKLKVHRQAIQKIHQQFKRMVVSGSYNARKINQLTDQLLKSQIKEAAGIMVPDEDEVSPETQAVIDTLEADDTVITTIDGELQGQAEPPAQPKDKPEGEDEGKEEEIVNLIKVAERIKELKPIVEPDYVCFAEHEGRPIGFALALPDFNQALKHANGRLFPFGLLKILWHSRKISRLRVLALGLTAPYRSLGIDQLMYLKIWQNGLRHGLKAGEFSWILEDNVAMRKPLDRFGFQVTKTYRIYEGTTEGSPSQGPVH